MSDKKKTVPDPDPDATISGPIGPGPGDDPEATVSGPFAASPEGSDTRTDDSGLDPERTIATRDASLAQLGRESVAARVAAGAAQSAPAKPDDPDATFSGPLAEFDPEATINNAFNILVGPRRRANPFAPKALPGALQANLAALGGLNDLLAFANPVLSAVPQIAAALSHPAPARLKETLQDLIEAFEAGASKSGVPGDVLEAATYALCCMVDDAAASTPWGSDWLAHGLLQEMRGENNGGEEFFALLANKKQAFEKGAAENAELLEFMYVCLALGFRGRYRDADGAGAAELAKIRADLHDLAARRRRRPVDGIALRWQPAAPGAAWPAPARFERAAPQSRTWRYVFAPLSALAVLVIAYALYKPAQPSAEPPVEPATSAAGTVAVPTAATPTVATSAAATPAAATPAAATPAAATPAAATPAAATPATATPAAASPTSLTAAATAGATATAPEPPKAASPSVAFSPPASPSIAHAPAPSSSVAFAPAAASRAPSAATPRAPSVATPREMLEKALAAELQGGLVAFSDEGGRVAISLRDEHQFASGTVEPAAATKALVERIAAAVERVKGPVLVRGYADSTPVNPAAYASNRELSSARAQAAAALLAARLTDPKRVSSQGMGEADPIAANDTAEHRARNRRVQVLVGPAS
ncbi:MAG: type IVB secretion system protein IcmH/DotU [Betaproteobacteria bacterium]